MTQLEQKLSDIDDKYGLSNGEKFESPEEIRAYFNKDSLESMFSEEISESQEDLDFIADLILDNKYHCQF